MYNYVLSPIDPDKLIEKIVNEVTANILKVVQKEPNGNLDKEEFLTVSEASKFLHLTLSTVYSKVSRGELPVMKRGKRLYFSKLELLEYLKRGKRKSEEELAVEAETYLLNLEKGLNHGK
ncbi:helix-turn-helix domain-containing protein [Christiangramia salexigens]|uniref:DNA-binding protein n=1 Tax=Christiangramia salexigens TaxID=1913577 RepID=A0A1L3J2J7_9FLAO|nr:helix-turn-helix domain-containing protein [Christiangramia salexigens]APG59343.1 DNA-binding protein [Christiangramia salexigens]